MKKNTILITKEIMKEAHAKTREFVELYQVDYQTQLGLFISYLLEEEKNNIEITIDDFIADFYGEGKGLYSYILHKNNILTKNGRQSSNQKAESNTSAFYQILPEDADDIEQLALLKVVERFDRENGTIQYKHRFSTWSYACLNATKEYQRNLAKFKPNKRLENGSPDIGYMDDGSLTILSNNDDFSITKLDYERVLSDRQYEIVTLLEQGYTKTEVAEMVGISRQAIHKNINKIQEILIENGLAIGY